MVRRPGPPTGPSSPWTSSTWSTPGSTPDSSSASELADALVVVTPEYNHSFPGPLKTAIDATSGQLRDKPVGFVAYGGMSGGLRAVEQLRPVLAELHAVGLRDTVSFHGAAGAFDGGGRPREESEKEAAAAVLLDALVWWARTLRRARDEHTVGSPT